jgi:MFS family permease
MTREQPRWAFTVRALKYRNYRLFFGGQIVSLIGTWMTTTATSWLVYRLTGSALMLGVVGFAGQFPAFVISPFAGTLVDRWDRHRLLIATQTISMCQSLALAVLTLTGRITIPMVIGLYIVQGIVNAFDMPCRQSFIINLIEDKDDLPNAIALNSSMFNAARLAGPSIAGGIIAAAGEGWIFLIDGISYLAVMIALLMMRITKRDPIVDRPGVMSQFRDGVRYISASTPIRSIMTLLALVSLVGFPYTVLMPVFATEILRGGPNTLGFLMAATGGGALIGALWLAARRSILGLGRIIPIAAAVFGAALIGFSFSRNIWLSLAILVVSGTGFMVQMASSNTVIQTIVDDRMRGRVMSFYVMAFLGTAPFGSLLAGALSSRIGAPATLRLGGICCIAAAAWFARGLPALRVAVRPIYVRMGILPEVTAGVQSATQLTSPPED